jgi:hypothetical protein
VEQDIKGKDVDVDLGNVDLDISVTQIGVLEIV